MNIEGVNLSSLLPGNNTIEVPGVHAFPENFSNALMGQIEVLSEATVQIESPGPLPNMTMPQTVNNGTDIGDLLKHKGDEQELAALFGKYLPVSNENDLNEDIDLETTLLALTDSLKAVTPNSRATDPVSTSDEVAAQNMNLISADSLKAVTPYSRATDPVSMPDGVAAQNMGLISADLLKAVTPDSCTTDPVSMSDEVAAQNMNLILADSLKAVTPDSCTTDPVSMSDEVAAQNMNLILADSLKAVTPDSRTTDPVSTFYEVATTDNMSLALTDRLKAVTPAIISDDVAAGQNRRGVTVLNGLSFTRSLPEETKLNMLGEKDVVSGDFLQKETVLRQPIQDKQGFNLPYVENTAPAEKTLVLEKQTSITEIEQAAPGVTSEIAPFHRQVDNRTDGPAITRPLTHPIWGKELGEQIIWMNNKAMPAAEIRLNPAHLGPISVRIDVNQDQATILFTAQHTEVREAIEASIPKLREMLGTQQLNLVNVNVSQNSMSDQGRSQSQTFTKTPENREQGIESVTDTIEQNEHDRVVVSKGLLSLYA